MRHIPQVARMRSTLLFSVICLCLAAVASGNVIPDQSDNALPLAPSVGANNCALQCRLRGAYDVPHPRSCDRFYRCAHGVLLELDCPLWQYFDHVTLRCREAGEARCILHADRHNDDESEEEGNDVPISD